MVTYSNNPAANAIIEDTSEARSVLRTMRDDARELYWKHHKALAAHPFKDFSDQTVALRKLGQLADALGQIEAAYSAINRIGCWLDTDK